MAYFDSQFSLFISKICVHFTFVILKVFRNMGKNDFVLILDTFALREMRANLLITD